MSAAIAPPASRNAPCPCGSGRRYKECHGRSSLPTAAPAPAYPEAIVARMREALAAQQQGRIEESIAGYDEVIREAPGAFDAWHMRGVAHLLARRFDAAEADIVHALELFPDLPMGRSNLALVEGGRRNAIDEERLSRATLPRFRPLVVDPAVAPLDGAGPGIRVFVIDAGAAKARTCDGLESDARALGAAVHRRAIDHDGRLPAADHAALGAAGANDIIVCAGCRWPLTDWTLGAHPRAIALVADGSRLAQVQDRLRELSGEGRRRVRLAVTDDAAVDLAPLPHRRIAS